MSQLEADSAERIAAEHFAGEARLQTAGWSSTGPDAAAELRTDGLEPAAQRARCSGGTRDWVVGSDGTPDLIAGASHYCVAPEPNTNAVRRTAENCFVYCSVRCVAPGPNMKAGRRTAENCFAYCSVRCVAPGPNMKAGWRTAENCFAYWSVAVLDCPIVVG